MDKTVQKILEDASRVVPAVETRVYDPLEFPDPFDNADLGTPLDRQQCDEEEFTRQTEPKD